MAKWFKSFPTERGWYFVSRSVADWRDCFPVCVRRIEDAMGVSSFEAAIGSHRDGWLPQQAFAGAVWFGPIDVPQPPDDVQPTCMGSDNPKCNGCGGPHAFDTSIESSVWNAVVRERGLPDYLCFSCIAKEFFKAGRGFSAKLYGDDVSGEIAVRYFPQP
jgi:hypothetical protein